MSINVSRKLALGATAFIAVQFLAVAAFAQQGPTLEDLAVIDAQASGSQSSGGDAGSQLADDARAEDPAIDRPAKADVRYADPDTEERIVRQSSGDYGEMERNVGMSLGTTQDAWNRPFENMAKGQSAPGVVRYSWSQEMVMPVRMREYMNTVIVLPDWENVKDVYLGEDHYFMAKKLRSNSISLRVRGAGVDTSLNILGSSGNIYTFYLRGESYNTTSISDMTVFIDAAPVNPDMWFDQEGGQVSKMDGHAIGGSTDDLDEPVQEAANTVSGGNLYIPSLDLKFVHKMYAVNPGDGAIAPEYVATDGRWTYFYYGDKAGTVDRPVVYRLVDGVEEPVPTKTIGAKGETLIVQRVGEFVLRNGQKTVCIKLAGDDGDQPL